MKKMRRLIPAIAMLLVSAVMLSTASFAWFTMNEAVTATGMEIKAKASGNLLISNAKMTQADQAITVGLKSDSEHTDVIPVTYTTAWQVPKDSSKVDPMYGGLNAGNVLTAADKDTDYSESPYFIDYTVYIATAGNDLEKQHLYVTMNMVSAAANIANAYSVAFYVGGSDTLTDLGTFAGYINYETFAKTAGTKVYLNGEYTIPSTFEKNADNKVGLRITMRVYVDGNLPYGEVATKVPDYVACTGKTWSTAMKDLKFYTRSGDGSVESPYVYTIVDSSNFSTTTDITKYFTWDGEAKVDGPKVMKYYVNNADIPTGFTSFDVTIGSTPVAEMPTGDALVTTKGITSGT